MNGFHRGSKQLAVFLLAVLSSFGLVVNALAASHPIVRDANGRALYLIVLKETAANAEPPGIEAPPRPTRDPANLVDWRGWHKPNVRALVRRLEHTYGVEALTMTSWALPAFSAYLDDAVAERLAQNPAVDHLSPEYEGLIHYSTWSDRTDGGETVPWGKIAIGTDDAITTSNRIYLIDGGARSTHVDLNIYNATVNPGLSSANPMHATHVAGILGAKANNYLVRGVDPNAPVVNVYANTYPIPLTEALDWVLADAEQNGVYAVANISMSGEGFTSGDLPKYMRRVSNRVFIAEAAGNARVDACTYAYNATNIYDGIMVVGGIDQNGGQAAPYDNTGLGPGWISERGSDYGPCVEVWAPSQQILSTYSTSDTATALMSGTSMAAPHVAAFAARYGGTSTTPVERETFVRGKLVGTGRYDDAGYWINIPSYTTATYTNIGTRLSVANVYADATASGSSPWNLVDGMYLSGVWNSGHPAPAWVEFDLGSTKTVTAIRMTPEQNPEGAVTHYVYAGNSPAPTTLVATISGNGATLEPLAAGINMPARYVRVYTASSPSWVAWREIEIYGY